MYLLIRSNNNAIFVYMKQGRFILTGIILIFFLCVPVHGQMFGGSTAVQVDTNYIKVYKDELTTRLYIARKQNGYTLSDRLFQPWIKYKTNDNILLGMGYTYSFLTINLGVKLPFINEDDELYGKSKYVDLQTNFLFRSYIVDLYLQWNSGYYLSNPDDVYDSWNNNEDIMPQRGDMRTNIVGLNVQRLFNSSRYSYKAAFWQNEFQKKSAGSAIVGAEAYWMLGMTDSLMVESAIPSSGVMDDQPFNQNDIVNVGINGGYTYTFVWAEKLYFSLWTMFGVSGAYHRVHYTPDSYTLSKGFSVGLTNNTKISLGFNSRRYYLGVSFSRFSMTTMAGSNRDWLSYHTGHIRINLVRRIRLKRSIKVLRPDLWIF
jgi:hypothetical protein